jgi:hypothetical protein
MSAEKSRVIKLHSSTIMLLRYSDIQVYLDVLTLYDVDIQFLR